MFAHFHSCPVKPDEQNIQHARTPRYQTRALLNQNPLIPEVKKFKEQLLPRSFCAKLHLFKCILKLLWEAVCVNFGAPCEQSSLYWFYSSYCSVLKIKLWKQHAALTWCDTYPPALSITNQNSGRLRTGFFFLVLFYFSVHQETLLFILVCFITATKNPHRSFKLELLEAKRHWWTQALKEVNIH